MFEIIGEIIFGTLFSWLGDTRETSVIGFVIKTIIRLLLCSILGLIGYFFLRNGLEPVSYVALGFSFLFFAAALFLFIRPTIKSILSLKKKHATPLE